jgi:hypothetical protein
LHPHRERGPNLHYEIHYDVHVDIEDADHDDLKVADPDERKVTDNRILGRKNLVYKRMIFGMAMEDPKTGQVVSALSWAKCLYEYEKRKSY